MNFPVTILVILTSPLWIPIILLAIALATFGAAAFVFVISVILAMAGVVGICSE